MTKKPLLYKIQRNAAAGYSINVETIEPLAPEHPHLLFCGGFRSNMRGKKANFLANLAERKSWGFTRFDYLGHGKSDALAEDCSLHDWLADTLAVIDSIPGKLVIIGSSMGAWLAVHAMLQRPEKFAALVTIAAAPDFTEKLLWPALNNDQKFSIQMNECITIVSNYGGEQWRLRAALFDSGKALALLNDTSALGIHVAIRMLHGTADVDVPWEMSKKLLERFSNSNDATLTLIAGADHRLSEENDLLQLELALTSLLTANENNA